MGAKDSQGWEIPWGRKGGSPYCPPATSPPPLCSQDHDRPRVERAPKPTSKLQLEATAPLSIMQPQCCDAQPQCCSITSSCSSGTAQVSGMEPVPCLQVSCDRAQPSVAAQHAQLLAQANNLSYHLAWVQDLESQTPLFLAALGGFCLAWMLSAVAEAFLLHGSRALLTFCSACIPCIYSLCGAVHPPSQHPLYQHCLIFAHGVKQQVCECSTV